MNSIRPTTSPPVAHETTDHVRPASRTAVQPVQLERDVEADRRRSLYEELAAAEERLPQAGSIDQEPGIQEVVEELGRLGPDALRVLQTIDPKVRRLVDSEHIDEQA